MTKEELIELVQKIVKESAKLKDDFTDQMDARVSYACIFTHSDEEFDSLTKLASEIGEIAEDTPTGPVFRIQELQTDSGPLYAVKIRKSDEAHPDRGDADFIAKDYRKLKDSYVDKDGFKLMVRPDCEMIELMKPGYDVRVYFSNPPFELKEQK